MYNRRNFLERVRKVNEIYLQYKSKGEQNEYIYQNYIREQFNISRATFYTYLTIPYKAEQKKLDDINSRQLSLF